MSVLRAHTKEFFGFGRFLLLFRFSLVGIFLAVVIIISIHTFFCVVALRICWLFRGFEVDMFAISIHSIDNFFSRHGDLFFRSNSAQYYSIGNIEIVLFLILESIPI